ncbi:MAG: transcription elongation factor subunit Spt4 [Nitrososphaeraceae archaeon]
MAKEFACKKCRAITIGKVCPVCKSTELSSDWSGTIVIFDSKNSLVASTLQIATPHKYALKVT